MDDQTPKSPDEGQTPTQAPAAAQTGQDAPQTASSQPPQEPGSAQLDEMQRELDEMRAKLADAERAKQDAVQGALAQQRGERTGSRQVTEDMSGLSQPDRSEKYADWPQEGGSDLPQPWDHRALGLHHDARELADNPGPNTVSPVVIDHGKPILTHGSSDPAVHELGRILGALGFHNSVSDGTNPYGSVDGSVMAAVHAFRDAYGVLEDPSGWGGDTPIGRRDAAAHIGPWTWEAILRAGKRLLSKV